MMKSYIVVAILYMVAGNESKRYAFSKPIEELLIEDAIKEALLSRSDNNNILEIKNHININDVYTRRKRFAIDDNDGIRPISFDPFVPEDPIPKAPPVDHGSTQVGLNCVNKNGGCLDSADGGRPVSFDVAKPQQLPVPPPVEHGSSQAGLNELGTDNQTNKPSEEHGTQGKVSNAGVSTIEVSTSTVSSTTKQVPKDQKTEPGRGHVVRPGCAPILILANIFLLFYYTSNII